MKPPLPRVHAVTDERIARRGDVDDVARELAAAGRADLALHARGRGLTGRAHYALAARLAALPALLFVNDRLDVALAAQAAGVQLGAGSLPVGSARALDTRWWVGKSVHDAAEAEAAQAEGADYLVVGPVYATATHPGRPPVGLEFLRRLAGLGLPLIAIGGLTPARAREVHAAGAYGVAAIGGLWEAPQPAAAVREMLEALR